VLSRPPTEDGIAGEAGIERNRLDTTFYFYEGLALDEIGEALNLSLRPESQVLRHALTRPQGLPFGPRCLAGELRLVASAPLC